MIEIPVLEGTRVRLEPMALEHLAGLEKVAFDERRLCSCKKLARLYRGSQF
jgi:hypothetical protein